MKKFIILLMILLPTTVLAANEPSIRFRPSVIKFQEASQHQQLQQTLAIKNAGKGIMNVRLRSSCECLSITPNIAAITSNNIQQIRLNLDTQDRAGKITEYIFVDSNDPVNPQVTLIVEGMVNGSHSLAANNMPTQTVTSGMGTAGVSVCLALFSTPNCKYCQRLKSEIIPQIGKKHGASIKLEVFEINQPENYKKLLLLEKQMNTQDTRLPVIFIDNHLLYGKKQIQLHLENEIKQCVSCGGCEYGDMLDILSDKPVHLTEKFVSVRLIPLLIAGLLDGINPCAFAAIIFFLSYLVLAGRGRKEILMIGISFTTAVFLAYLLIGLGIFHVLKIANFRIINYLIASMTIILGILSIIDYLKIKQGKLPEDVPLPQAITKQIINSNTSHTPPADELICSGTTCHLPKTRIYQSICKHGTASGYILSSFGLGVIISLLEFSCTGQIYVPTLMYMAKLSGLKMLAFGYLILYNLMFIAPLIVIFLLSYNGVNSKTLSEFAKKHVAAIKLAIAVFFFGMGILLLVW